MAQHKHSRQPSQEELNLWRYVTRNDVPLHPEFMVAAEVEPVREVKAIPCPALPAPVSAAKTPLAYLQSGALSELDGSLAKRLKRGEIPVEITLDLHGMSRERAHSALTDRVETAYALGLRCLLVVTGKGQRGAVGAERGVLKAQLPLWLNDAALRAKVLAFQEAKPKHGGGGAFYVLLKRRRERA